MKRLPFQVTLAIVDSSSSPPTFRLEKMRNLVGRGVCDVVLKDKQVSQRHAMIEITPHGVVIEDMGSRNGIFVNGRRVEHSPLLNLDEIRLGTTKLKIAIVDDLESFREQNRPDSTWEEQETEVKQDISNLIDDELRRFSKWDLSIPSQSLPNEEVAGKSGYGLEVLEGPDQGQKISIPLSFSTLGRGKAKISFHDKDISRLHAELEVLGKDQIILRDLGSTNGTFVNGKKISEAKIWEGDKIQLGNTLCKLVKEN